MTIDYSSVGGYGPDSTPGHSGTDTSREAALAPGIGERTAEIHDLIQVAGTYGMNARELCHYTGRTHGAISGALTRLHRAGLITRLQERRNKQQVYVTPEHAADRPTSPYTPNRAHREHTRPMPLDRSDDTSRYHHGDYTPLLADMAKHGLNLEKWREIRDLIEKYGPR